MNRPRAGGAGRQGYEWPRPGMFRVDLAGAGLPAAGVLTASGREFLAGDRRVFARGAKIPGWSVRDD
jgi:hypothetical protein